MLAEVAVIPSAPLLVPELTGPGAPEAVAVRDAVRAAGVSLAEAARRWIAVGATPGDGPAVIPLRGTFAGYGVDLPVVLSPIADAGPAAPGMPLSMLVAAWLRGQCSGGEASRVGDEIVVEPLGVPAGATPQRCRALGETLTARLAASDEPVGLLVVGDGANALSRTAPGGGERESAWALQRKIDAALAAADGPALAALDPDE
ncbi:MAG: hypothetical protein QM658_17560, partial [Gordonia sp. (in: high G+C Gram-positive bacteria)]